MWKESTQIPPPTRSNTQWTRFAQRGVEKKFYPAKFCLSEAMQQMHTRVPKHVKILGHFRSSSAASHLLHRKCSTTRKDRGSWRPNRSTVTSPIRIPTRSNLASEVNSQTPGDMENIQRSGRRKWKRLSQNQKRLTMAS
jgi:hypothetical protein